MDLPQFVHPSLDHSTFWWLWAVLLWTLVCILLCGRIFLILLSALNTYHFRYVICKYFPSFYGLSFHFFCGGGWRGAVARGSAHSMACRISMPWPGIEKVWSLKPWTVREVPLFSLFWWHRFQHISFWHPVCVFFSFAFLTRVSNKPFSNKNTN